jgi:multiple sugar transport system ATP-binding protein
LEHIQKTQHSTTLYVTHDQVEALTLADRIAVLRQGRIVQIGTPQDIYDRPATIFVAQSVGAPRINLLPARCENNQISITASSVQLPLPVTGESLPTIFTLGIRPEDVQPASDGAFGGQVVLIEPLGVETILHIKSGDQTLLSIVSGMTRAHVNDTVRFNIVRENLHYFDSNGSRILV